MHRVTKVLGLARGLRAAALALGAGLKTSPIEAGGHSPGRVPGVTPLGAVCLLQAARRCVRLWYWDPVFQFLDGYSYLVLQHNRYCYVSL